jgi:hypothetical protein
MSETSTFDVDRLHADGSRKSELSVVSGNQSAAAELQSARHVEDVERPAENA